MIFTDIFNSSLSFNLSKDVYNLQTSYFGKNLNVENKNHYENATIYQKNAISNFKNSDLANFISNMTMAKEELIQINL